jgi:ribonuclease D
LIAEPDAIAAVASAIAKAPLVAFDLEFASADRLVPLLCLVQVAWLDDPHALDAPAKQIVAAAPEIRIVDPIAGDAGPIVRALATHPCVIAHAPRQDLALLAARFGTSMTGLVDTQLMAAFVGLGDQVGLATLANEMLGTSLGKELQWTAWERRPLSDAQLAYAASDVRHLPALYALLAGRLGERLAWVRAETAEVVADALAAVAVTPETAWQQVGGTRGLDPAAHAAVVALASWRQRTAIELDRPLGQVLGDKQLLELARLRPKDPGGVRGTKGLSPLAKTRAAELVATLAAIPEPAAASRPPARPAPASARAQRWGETLLAIAHVVADETKIASRLLATRADAEEFARVYDEHGPAAAAKLPALATWRRDVLGTMWEGWLAGRIAIVGDTASPHGVRLVQR